MDMLDIVVLDNSLQTWLTAALTALVALLVLRLGINALRRRMSRVAERTVTRIDDLFVAVLGSTKVVFLILFAVYLGSLKLQISPRAGAVLASIAMLALLAQAGFWGGTALKAGLREYAERRLSEDPAALTTMNAAAFLGRIVLWSVVFLLALDNLGVDITTLIAGLGIGGIAVALAAQNILADLFASLTIVLDKPFVIKDFLIVNELMGTVEHVGLKTTRVRSLSGEQLVFSNADLLSSRIRNYGRMFERRVVFGVGVVYQTPRAKLQAIPVILRSAIESQDKTRFDRAHFKEYGPYSLNFEAVYYVLDASYNTYMDTQQAINFFIHEEFEEQEIEFAYPSQTLFVVESSQPGPPVPDPST